MADSFSKWKYSQRMKKKSHILKIATKLRDDD